MRRACLSLVLSLWKRPGLNYSTPVKCWERMSLTSNIKAFVLWWGGFNCNFDATIYRSLQYSCFPSVSTVVYKMIISRTILFPLDQLEVELSQYLDHLHSLYCFIAFHDFCTAFWIMYSTFICHLFGHIILILLVHDLVTVNRVLQNSSQDIKKVDDDVCRSPYLNAHTNALKRTFLSGLCQAWAKRDQSGYHSHCSWTLHICYT